MMREARPIFSVSRLLYGYMYTTDNNYSDENNNNNTNNNQVHRFMCVKNEMLNLDGWRVIMMVNSG